LVSFNCSFSSTPFGCAWFTLVICCSARFGADNCRDISPALTRQTTLPRLRTRTDCGVDRVSPCVYYRLHCSTSSLLPALATTRHRHHGSVVSGGLVWRFARTRVTGSRERDLSFYVAVEDYSPLVAVHAVEACCRHRCLPCHPTLAPPSPVQHIFLPADLNVAISPAFAFTA